MNASALYATPQTISSEYQVKAMPLPVLQMFKFQGSNRKMAATMTKTETKTKRDIRSQQAARHTAAVYASGLLGFLGPGEFMSVVGEVGPSEDFLPQRGEH